MREEEEEMEEEEEEGEEVRTYVERGCNALSLPPRASLGTLVACSFLLSS